MFRLNACVRALAFGAISASAIAYSSAPVAAQLYPVHPAPPPPAFGLMPPHEADALVRSLGLTPIAPPRAHGPVIFVNAVGQEGSQVRVTVDRRTGRVREIVRFGPAAPRIVGVQPGPGYVYDDYDDEDDLPPPYAQGPGPYSGPQVITREEIQANELPPPGTGPRVVTREPEYTGSVPPSAARRSVDPLLGVPPTFRNRPATGEAARAPGREKLAARTREPVVPNVAPLPRPRPADAPAVARRDSAAPAPTPPARTDADDAPAADETGQGEEAEKYPVQPLE